FARTIDTLFENNDAFETAFRRRGGRLARMVRLYSPRGDEGGRPFLECIANQEFKFAGFIAAGAKAGAVVALDEDVRAAQVLRQAGKKFKRRGKMGERNPGVTRK